MKKSIMKLLSMIVSTALFVSSVSISTYAREVENIEIQTNSEDAFIDEEEYEESISVKSSELKLSSAKSGVTEEQLFRNCPAYLNNNRYNQIEEYSHRAINKALGDYSSSQPVLASYLKCLQEGASIIISEHLLTPLGISSSQKDQAVDAAVMTLVQEYLKYNNARSDSISNVKKLYSDYIKPSYNIYSEVEKKNLIEDLKAANTHLSNDEVNSIVKKMTEDSILSDILKVSGDGLEASFLIANIIELQEIELATIDDMIEVSIQSNNNDLHMGLNRLRSKITANPAEYVVQKYLSKKVLSKIAGKLKNAPVKAFLDTSSGTALVIDLIIDGIVFLYELNRPSADQIIQAEYLRQFSESLSHSVNVYYKGLVKKETNYNYYVKYYKIAHDFYYSSLICALEAAKKCTNDKEIQSICSGYANGFRNTWNYSDYIDHCLEAAQKDIDSGKLKLPASSSYEHGTGGMQGEDGYDSYESILAKFNEIKAHYPVGSTWRGNWGGAIQCFGFARMVFSKVFGCEMPARQCNPDRYKYETNTNVDIIGQLSGSAVSKENVKRLMSQGKLGDIIQVNGSTYGQHTAIFESYQDNGVLVYDCNSAVGNFSGTIGACGINEWTITWDYFVNWYGGGSNAGITLYRASNYASIYGDGDGLFYDDTVNFVVDENGILTKYNGWQSFVEIPEEVHGITIVGIGDSAFSGNKTMVSVSIPDTVKSIGAAAFKNCTALAGVLIPDNVESIGDNAFNSCKNMGFVILPDNLKYTTIESWTFYGCSDLVDVDLSDNITKIDNAAFAECSALKYIDLPDSIIQLGSGYYVTGAFQNCSSLNNVVLPPRLKFLGEDSFNGCTSLSGKIIIPKTVEETGYYAGVFGNCVNLKTIEFEKGMTTIPSKILSNCNYVEEIIIPDTVTVIDNGAFSGCEKIKTIDLPNSLTIIGGDSFNDCTNLEEIIIPDSVTKIGTGTSGIVKGTFRNCISLTSITLPSRLSYLGDYAFSGCTGLSGKIVIPKTVEKVGYYACIFSGCTNLETIEFENGVTTIPKNALAGCNYVEEIILPESVKSIDGSAFSGCTALKNINLPNSITSISGSVFKNCESIVNVELPNSINKIPENMFNGCKKLEEISIPDKVTVIEYNAFKGCNLLTSTNLPNGIVSIGASAFENCINLISMVIPDSVERIENNIFNGCSELKSIDLGKGITKIPQNAFSNCSKLESIDIPYYVTAIDSK